MAALGAELLLCIKHGHKGVASGELQKGNNTGTRDATQLPAMYRTAPPPPP